MSAIDGKVLEYRLLTKDSSIAGSSATKCAVMLHESKNIFFRDLYLYKLDIEKSIDEFNVIAAQFEEYQGLELGINESINQTNDDISNLNVQLRQEQDLRKHRIDCEEMAKAVNVHPTRAILKRKIDSITETIHDSTNQLALLDKEIVNRKKIFSSLLVLVEEILKDNIELNTTTENDENDGLEDDEHAQSRRDNRGAKSMREEESFVPQDQQYDEETKNDEFASNGDDNITNIENANEIQPTDINPEPSDVADMEVDHS
eukprot:gene10202-13726_t